MSYFRIFPGDLAMMHLGYHKHYLFKSFGFDAWIEKQITAWLNKSRQCHRQVSVAYGHKTTRQKSSLATFIP